MRFHRSRFARVWLPLLAAASIGTLALRIDTENRVQDWVASDSEARRLFDEFRKDFGSDEFVLISVTAPDPLAPESLDAQLDVLAQIEGVEGVESVFSPAGLFRDLFGAEDPEELRSELESTDFFRRLIVSDDYGTVGFLVTVSESERSSARYRLLDELEAATEPLRSAGAQIDLVGPPVLMSALDRASIAEARRSLPLAVAASLIFLGVLLQSVRAAAITVGIATTSLLFTVGLMGALGRSLNMFTAALPALLWVLSLAVALHLVVRYRELRRQHEHALALELTIRRTRFPCSVAAGTTAVGFLALRFAPMQPVRELGLLAAAGILISLAVCFWLGVGLVDWLQPGPSRVQPFNVLRRGAQAAFARPSAALSSFVLVTIATALLAPRIELSSNPLSFLPPTSPVMTSYTTVGERLGGLSGLEVVVRHPGTWLEPDLWQRADELGQRLEGREGIAKVRSPVRILAKLNQWSTDLSPESYQLPETAASASSLIEDAEPFVREQLSQMVAQGAVRLSVLIRTTDSEEFAALRQFVQEEADRSFRDDRYTVAVTGLVSRLVDAQRVLVSSQLRSLGLALGAIFLCLWLAQRSLRWAILAIFPNLAPICVVFLLMSLFALPLDPGTLMVACVALGIAVDDTVHLVVALRRHLQSGEPRESVGAATSEVGTALLITSGTATVGFLSLAIAEFVPIQTFGLLSAVAMVVAFGAAVVLLPAMLGLRYSRSQ